MESVTIEAFAIVVARSVFTKDRLPYAIIVGNPEKIIRFCFPEEICQVLLESQWWYYPIDVLKTLPMNNHEKFLKAISPIRKGKVRY